MVCAPTERGDGEQVLVTFYSTIASAAHDGSRFHLRIGHADGTTSKLDSEALLFCIGRVPNSDNIGIKNTDLKLNSHDYIQSDDRLPHRPKAFMQWVTWPVATCLPMQRTSRASIWLGNRHFQQR